MFSKKFFLFLILLIALFAFLLSKEIRRATGIVTKPSEEPLIASGFTPIPLDDADIPLGNPGAPITVVEFANFNCRRCREVHATLAAFVSQRPQDYRLIWKYAPADGWFSDNFELAHQGAYCAGRQGKLWQFLELGMQDKANLEEPRFSQIPSAIRLNVTAWQQCLTSDESARQIAEAGLLSEALGISKLPAIFVNNRKILADENINLEEMLAKFNEK